MDLLSKPEPLAQDVWLRRLRAEELGQALDLSSLTGWNQTADDWRMLLELEPEGCFAVEADGRVAATAALVCYGTRLAWVGMVLTRPEYRRRGFATYLVAALLARADALGVATVMLDATEQGAPIYETLGFHATQPVERWSRAGAGANAITVGGPAPEGAWWKDDEAVFGADRSRLLATLAERGSLRLGAGGYLLSRAGRVSRYLGPCVAGSVAEAREMIEQCIESEAAGSWMWDLLPQNGEAVRLATALGFAPVRKLVRMTRGRELREKTERMYAIAGFELG